MILDLCKDPGWRDHIESVVKFSEILARKLNADIEICLISAWLHDIKKIKGEKDKHHVHGSEEAGEILMKLYYPADRIEKVKHCILTHSSDMNYIPKSIEAKVITSADALSHFSNFLDLAQTAFTFRKLSLEEGRNWLIKKYQGYWNKVQILPEARDLVKDQYDAIKLILGI